MQRVSLVALSALGVCLAAACNGDGPADSADLPSEPQLLPNSQAGILGFRLVPRNESNRVEAVFINGGKKTLKVDLTRLRLEGPGASAFTLGAVVPASGEVRSKEAMGIPITFTSPGRGVYLATLVVESNAENLPVYRLDLVGPGGDFVIPDAPDIAFFEDPVPIEQETVLPVPAAVVRFYNLGGRSLNVYEYELSNTTTFRLLRGTAQPGVVCSYGAICGPGDGLEQGCCEGGLRCRCNDYYLDGSTCVCVTPSYPTEPPPANVTCEQRDATCADVIITSGQFNALAVVFTDPPPASGTHTTELRVHSNDPDSPIAVVDVTGQP